MYYLLLLVLLLLLLSKTFNSAAHFTTLQSTVTSKLIKLKPIALMENGNIDEILVKFNSNLTDGLQFKRLELMLPSNLFYINNTQLTLNLGRELDRELLINNKQCSSDIDLHADCVIRLKVAAYDSSNSLVAIYIVPLIINDFNDHSPEFRHTVYRVNISENLLSATQIPLDAPIDLDSYENGIRECQIESKDNSNNTITQFEAYYNRETHRLHLLVKQSLDRENISHYDLYLRCSDGLSFARAHLQIDVLDANDNVPYFKQNSNSSFTFNIEENSSSAFLSLQADDHDDSKGPNGQLVYSLPFELNSNQVINELFHIDQVNGTLSVRSNAHLDYEKRSKYHLKVKVQDKGPNPVALYGEVHVNLIDVNDNAPQGHLTFVEKYLMKQDKLNSTIWIYEEQKLQTILAYLTVTDADSSKANGHTLSAELLDNRSVFKLVPIIQEYENLYYALQVIGRLDRDQSDCFYDLTFKLRDQSQESYLKLRIILLDLNDNRPLFHQQVYTFNLTENKFYKDLMQIKAIDLDLENTLTYQLIDTPSTLPFVINSTTGSLSLLSGKQLDREQFGKYEFKCKCSDNGHLFSEAKVIVNVLDENDELPKFVNWTSKGLQVDFDEEQPIASLITQFKAIDFDSNSSVFYFMKPDTMNNYFSINNSTGILSSKIKLDAEKHPAQFVFDVIAVDLDRSLSEQLAEPINEQKLKININLIDLNDNKPIITNKFNYSTLNYTATDSANSTDFFIYSIQSNDSDRDFFNTKKLNNRHLFRIGLIKYIDWNRLSHLIIHPRIQSISLPLEQQQQQQLWNYVDLKNIFTLNISNETNKADLMLKKSKLAKSGLYLFQIQVIDRSMSASQKSSSSSSASLVLFKKKQFWKTEFMFKLFLYDESFQEYDLEQLNSLFDKFWQTKTIKEQQQFLEESEQEYFQLNHRNNNNSSSIGVSSTLTIQEFNLKKIMFSNSSDWIIYLISLFMFISILLISIISYKHYKASVINNQNDSTASTHDTNATNSPQQKSKSLTVLSQTNLSVDSSTPPPLPPPPPPISKQEQQEEQSASCSFFESFIQPPLLASNDLTKEETKQNSDSSFTMITAINSDNRSIEVMSPLKNKSVVLTVPGYSQANYKQITQQPSSCSSSASSASSASSSCSFLSTFHVKQPNNEQQVIAIIEHDNEMASTDLGYYSSQLPSSDSSSSTTRRQHSQSKSQVYRHQQHRPSKYVNSNLNSLCNSITSSSTTASSSLTAAAVATVATVINSASASSSPIFRTNSNNIKQQPTITNLYPPYTFSNNVNNNSVKVYLERFERIYNSPPPEVSSRTNATTYSYV